MQTVLIFLLGFLLTQRWLIDLVIWLLVAVGVLVLFTHYVLDM